MPKLGREQEGHTHRWRAFVQGVNGEDVSYWLKKVQFKLHETYQPPIRTIEEPPFEISETGWGEFEMQIKLYLVPESTEKPQTLYHTLKLHHFGPGAEERTQQREPVLSQNYEEIVFNEPVEQFYDYMTGGTGSSAGNNNSSTANAKGKNAKGKNQSKLAQSSGSSKQAAGGGRTAEIPYSDSATNPYSRKTEAKELDKLAMAYGKVTQMVQEEKESLAEREAELEELRKSEGVSNAPPPKKK